MKYRKSRRSLLAVLVLMAVFSTFAYVYAADKAYSSGYLTVVKKSTDGVVNYSGRINVSSPNKSVTWNNWTNSAVTWNSVTSNNGNVLTMRNSSETTKKTSEHGESNSNYVYLDFDVNIVFPKGYVYNSITRAGGCDGLTSMWSFSGDAGSSNNRTRTAKISVNTGAIGLKTYSGNVYHNSLTLSLKPITYTVTYDGNGATSGSTGNSTHTYNKAAPLTQNGFARPGYTFKGWNTQPDGSGASYTNKQSVQNLTAVNDGTVKLYAQWEEKVGNLVKVTFDPNGGEMIGNSIVDRTNGSTVNYTEKGLRLSSSQTSIYPQLDLASYNLGKNYSFVVKAKREGGYYLLNNTDAGGVEIAMSDSNTYHVRYLPAQSQYMGPSTSAHSNQDVWIVGTSDGSNMKLYIDGQPVVTSWACTQNYVASNAPVVFGYNPNASGGNDGGGEFTGVMYKAAVYGRALSDAEIAQMYETNTLIDGALTKADAEVGTPVRKCYSFQGWYTEPEGGTRITENTTVSGPVTYYAHWEPQDFTIKYRANGGSGSMEQGVVSPDSTVTLADSEYENDGYRFVGWNTKPDGSGTMRNAEDPISFEPGYEFSLDSLTDEDLDAAIDNGNVINLYAQWQDIKKTIHFKPNGGEGEMPDQQAQLDREEKVNENQFTKPGALFKGWCEKKDGSTSIFEDECLVDELDYPKDAKEITLYAIWQKGSFVMEDQTVTDSDFIKIRPDAEGKATVHTQLSDGQKINIFGMDKGALYTVTEGAAKSYVPSFDTYKGKEFMDVPKAEGEFEQNLSTEVETVLGDTGIMYTNRKTTVPGLNLSFAKSLKGNGITDADKEKQFTFHYIVTGLDQEYEYILNYPDGTEVLLTPDSNGTLSGDIPLKGGEEAAFKNLPEGAKYSISEVLRTNPSDSFDYTPRYDVIEGTVQSESGTADASTAMRMSTNAGSSDTISGYGAETITDDVSYVFTNTKGSPHALYLYKETELDGTQDTTNTEAFTFRVFFSGLTANHTYTASFGTASDMANNTMQGYSNAAFTTNGYGKAELTVTLHRNEAIRWNGLDPSCEYEVVEQECNYEARAVIAGFASGDDLCEMQGVYSTGVEIGNTMQGDDGEEIGFNEDQVVNVTNDKPTHRSLKISKFTADAPEGDTTSFSYTASLSGLDASTSYSYRNENDGTAHSFTSNGSGEANVSFSLKDGETCVFPALKMGASYTVTEAGKAKWQPSYELSTGITTEEGEEDETPETGSAAVGQSLSTGEHTLSTDHTVRYTNTKAMDPPVKRVSDTDGKTMTGDGAETLVEENYVPGMDKTWTYTITQNIEPGFSEYFLYDEMPDNVKVLPDSVRLTYVCGNGTTYGPSLSKVVEDYETHYQNAVFRIDSDGYRVDLTTREGTGNTAVGAGGTLTLTFDAMLDSEAKLEDFRNAAQVTPDENYVKVENIAEATLDDHNMATERTVTTIPLDTGEAGLSIHKNVTGDLGDLTKEFSFTIRFRDLQGKATYEYKTYQATKQVKIKRFTAGADGTATIYLNLRDDEGVTFTGLPDSTHYRVTEDSSDHVASFCFTRGTESVSAASGHNDQPYMALSTKEEKLDQSVAPSPHILFTNRRELNPPTGMFSGGSHVLFVFLLMMEIAVLSGIRRKLGAVSDLNEGSRWWK